MTFFQIVIQLFQDPLVNRLCFLHLFGMPPSPCNNFPYSLGSIYGYYSVPGVSLSPCALYPAVWVMAALLAFNMLGFNTSSPTPTIHWFSLPRFSWTSPRVWFCIRMLESANSTKNMLSRWNYKLIQELSPLRCGLPIHAHFYLSFVQVSFELNLIQVFLKDCP